MRTALDAIVGKQIPGWEIEVIVVESGSTDGTRDVVLGYREHPRVTLILEDRAYGKGHAVRAALARATGDVILIQDADLEYDLADYEELLAPLASGRQTFVLGSRHGEGGFAIRKFSGHPLQAFALNSAHWVFTILLNASLGIWLRDPFTMYKVFRRDCLAGLTFECDRFDFDWELLIKLVRKGYRPIEIPVSYRSRSFKDGKKVRIFRDPVSWMVALVKFRFLQTPAGLAHPLRMRGGSIRTTAGCLAQSTVLGGRWSILPAGLHHGLPCPFYSTSRQHLFGPKADRRIGGPIRSAMGAGHIHGLRIGADPVCCSPGPVRPLSIGLSFCMRARGRARAGCV